MRLSLYTRLYYQKSTNMTPQEQLKAVQNSYKQLLRTAIEYKKPTSPDDYNPEDEGMPHWDGKISCHFLNGNPGMPDHEAINSEDIANVDFSIIEIDKAVRTYCTACDNDTLDAVLSKFRETMNPMEHDTGNLVSEEWCATTAQAMLSAIESVSQKDS